MLLSVVIPTRNRRERLLRTLARLGSQEQPNDGVEVVVVDDGSADGTMAALEATASRAPVPIRSVASGGAGPAAARNEGVAAARGSLILFLGDDTEPAHDGLLVGHAALHERTPSSAYAVLGRVAWDPSRGVTPLMRWLDEGGQQFDYGSISPGPVKPSSYLYSSHVSLKREAIESVGGFDDRFRYAAVEDTELGLRLEEAGLELDYHPELLVNHDHPTELAGSLERTALVGRSAALFNRLHPDRPHPKVRQPTGPRWALFRAGTPLLRRLPVDKLPWPAATLSWRIMHRAAYVRGYRMGPP